MDFQQMIVTIVMGAISVAVSFYLKDFLVQKSQRKKLRKKLEKIAGKNANIIYGGDEIFKIKEIDENGITLENELKIIFIPTAKLLNTSIVLPSDNYSNIIKQKKGKDNQEMATILAKQMTEEMKTFFPNVMMPVQEQSKETNQALVKLLERMESESTKDSTKELISLLIESGAMQQPDPMKLIALKFAKLLSDNKDQTDTKN